MAPTEAGRRLQARLGPLLQGLDEAVRDVREASEQPVGTLRVDARRSFAMPHLTPALPAFLAAHPRLAVDLEPTETVEIAPGEGVDVAVRLGAPSDESLEAHRLASGDRLRCASPSYLERAAAPSMSTISRAMRA